MRLKVALCVSFLLGTAVAQQTQVSQHTGGFETLLLATRQRVGVTALET